MKTMQTIVCLLCFLFVRIFCFAQQSNEDLLKNLENSEREAILKGDTIMLMKLLSPQIVVHNPENKIVKLDQMIERIRNGKINYSSFERIIEHVSFHDNIGIVMGKEILTPVGSAINSGKTVTRRFTNIWIKKDQLWKLSVRQATIIAVN